MTSYTALQYFIETSFHEDWDLDGATDFDVVESFARRDSAKVTIVVGEIANYLASDPSPDATRAWLDDLGCAYDSTPDGLDANQWLSRLSTTLGLCADLAQK